jgi:hypothetical protein
LKNYTFKFSHFTAQVFQVLLSSSDSENETVIKKEHNKHKVKKQKKRIQVLCFQLSCEQVTTFYLQMVASDSSSDDENQPRKKSPPKCFKANEEEKSTGIEQERKMQATSETKSDEKMKKVVKQCSPKENKVRQMQSLLSSIELKILIN